ncbi:hypothetical protein [Candidatus Synchoanobacter obligatus]|uniref:Tetratricopeptide repeat protein n=1 Tax=Candidatus Synchoanobacter obligatus TaxID=2919597 RepID=A0ABT1L436_9GAMM|nr:hypothetical protein [Candidatus Synchoanobacter obligatus]MCP8351726.1 hypothetical protein [Candidatus Synchoanobacter obligatus]
MWMMVISGYILLGCPEILYNKGAVSVKQQLSIKCQTNPGACFLLSKLAWSDKAYLEAKDYCKLGLLLDPNMDALLQLDLMIDHRQYGFIGNIQDRMDAWLKVHPDDHMIRQIYAEALLMNQQEERALEEYGYLLLIHSDSALQKEVRQRIQDISTKVNQNK